MFIAPLALWTFLRSDSTRLRPVSRQSPISEHFQTFGDWVELRWVGSGAVNTSKTESWSIFIWTNGSRLPRGKSAKETTLSLNVKKADATFGICYLLKLRKKRNKSCRRKPWAQLGEEQGAYNNLLAELNADGSLRNYIRITKAQFNDIVERMTPVVQRTNTNQAANTPSERLAFTLRFLATGA